METATRGEDTPVPRSYAGMPARKREWANAPGVQLELVPSSGLRLWCRYDAPPPDDISELAQSEPTIRTKNPEKLS